MPARSGRRCAYFSSSAAPHHPPRRRQSRQSSPSPCRSRNRSPTTWITPAAPTQSRRGHSGPGQRLPCEIKFAVGQPVKEGAVLFVIDRRPYQAALEQAVAQVKLADANLKLAVTEVKRNEPLVKNGATTQSEFDKLVAARDVSAATIEAAKAFRDNAQLNLDFCTVKSPIAGRSAEIISTPATS